MNTIKKLKAKQTNFLELFSGKKVGPNGRSKEWVEVANSPEMIKTFEEEGSSSYFKELKRKFEQKGFYKEWFK